MATVDVVTVENKRAGRVELDPAVFEAVVKDHLLHAEVRRQLAHRRAGTHSSKNRSAVSGGGIKPWRQKGTGRARQGSIRSPQWAGGGVVFGPVPRSHEHKLPKKVRRAALRGALSQKLRDGALTVVEGFGLSEYKTKRMAEILTGLGLSGKTALIVLEAADPYVEGSARNLRGVGVVRAEGLNVYDVLRHAHVVVTKPALEAIHARLVGEGRA
jgi:large subunit ribosomal protein L4